MSLFKGNYKLLWMLFILLAVIGSVFLYSKYQGIGLWKGQNQHFVQLEPVIETPQIIENYDVIVIGTDPEGLAAAISAGRNGLKTLLVDGKNREILGGLITLGWLNSQATMDVRLLKESLLSKMANRKRFTLKS